MMLFISVISKRGRSPPKQMYSLTIKKKKYNMIILIDNNYIRS